MPGKIQHLIKTVLYSGLSGLFAWVFYVRYWKWRDCIAEALSSCVTPEGENLIEGGAFWAVPALVFGVMGVLQGRRWRMARQSGDKPQ